MKKRAKNLAIMLVAILLVAQLAACGKQTNDDSENASTPTAGVTATATPTVEPTAEPTATPTLEPTAEPTATPTLEPTAEPTAEPTVEPTVEPTAEPTTEPTVEPTVEPTAEPTAEITGEPTVEPTGEPTAEPTTEPTPEITGEPTTEPTPEITGEPTTEPTPEATPTPFGAFDIPEKWDVSDDTIEELRAKYAVYAETKRDSMTYLVNKVKEEGHASSITFLKDVIRPHELLGPQYVNSLMDFWVYEVWSCGAPAYTDAEPVLCCRYYLYFPERRDGVHERRLLFSSEELGTTEIAEGVTEVREISLNEESTFNSNIHVSSFERKTKLDETSERICGTYVVEFTSGVVKYIVEMRRDMSTDENGDRNCDSFEFVCYDNEGKEIQRGSYVGGDDNRIPIKSWAGETELDATIKWNEKTFGEDYMNKPVCSSMLCSKIEENGQEPYLVILGDSPCIRDVNSKMWPEYRWMR